MRRGFKTWAEECAGRLRTELNLVSVAPLSASELAKHLNVGIIIPDDIPKFPSDVRRQLLEVDPSSWSAVTILIEDWPLIISNPNNSLARWESDLMHELAHTLCEHLPIRILQPPGWPLPLREHDDAAEEEAKWLGACLQVPRPALLRAVRRGMTNELIATEYGASVELVRFRRNVTGVDRQVARARRHRGVRHVR